MQLEIWHLWIFLTVGLFILEVYLSNFKALCVGLSALGTAVIAYFDYSLAIQLASFAILNLFLLLMVKPIFNRNLVSKTAIDLIHQNNIIGKEGYVIEEINSEKQSGRIIVAGTGRRAISQFGEQVPEGSFVKIVDIQKGLLIVQKVEILLET